LQEAAGFPLFDKAGTGLRLNGHGNAMLRFVTEALDKLESGWERLLDDAGGPVVHVACSATFARRWLVPRLSDFYKAHPDVRLRLSMTTARELRFEGADLVVAWDRSTYPAVDRAKATPLGDVAFGPVCAPGYPARPVEVQLRMPARIAHEYTVRAWDDWKARSGLSLVYEAELRFPHTHLCIEAAIAGLGVAMVERRLVADDISTGRLVAPCGFTGFAEGWAAMPFSERAETPAAHAFVAWLRTTLV
jgi:DNA-binding transcriptional LysR family regulator